MWTVNFVIQLKTDLKNLSFLFHLWEHFFTVVWTLTLWLLTILDLHWSVFKKHIMDRTKCELWRPATNDLLNNDIIDQCGIDSANNSSSYEPEEQVIFWYKVACGKGQYHLAIAHQVQPSINWGIGVILLLYIILTFCIKIGKPTTLYFNLF